LNENQAQTLKRFRHLKFNKIFFAARICQHKKEWACSPPKCL